jgi:hypothetical protein
VANRVGGDCQLAYVSVSLTGEMALLADGYHSGDAGLIDGDQDCAVLAGSGGEGVRKPLLGGQHGGLAVPPGCESLGKSGCKPQHSGLVVFGRGANMDVCAIHVSSMPREPFYIKVHCKGWRHERFSWPGFIYSGVSYLYAG